MTQTALSSLSQLVELIAQSLNLFSVTRGLQISSLFPMERVCSAYPLRKDELIKPMISLKKSSVFKQANLYILITLICCFLQQINLYKPIEFCSLIDHS